MFLPACNIAMLTSANIVGGQSSTISTPVKLNNRVVSLMVQLVTFRRGSFDRWETDEFDRMRQVPMVTTLPSKAKELVLQVPLEKLTGMKDRHNSPVPIHLTMTPTYAEEKLWRVRLQLALEITGSKPIRFDATQIVLDHGRTYFVIPLTPRRDMEVFFTIMVCPGLLSEKDSANFLKPKQPVEIPQPTP